MDFKSELEWIKWIRNDLKPLTVTMKKEYSQTKNGLNWFKPD
jgi:hypothetical protein